MSLLGKVGVKVSFEFDKVVLTKNNVFMGKDYCNKGLFVLNINNDVNDNASTFASNDCSDLWHSKLRHICSSYVKSMQNLGLILGINFKDNNSKCQIYAATKLTKKYYKSINREFE